MAVDVLGELGAILRVVLRLGATWRPSPSPRDSVLGTTLRQTSVYSTASVESVTDAMTVAQVIQVSAQRSPSSLVEIGVDLLKAGRAEQSLVMFEAVLEANPLLVDAHIARTVALVALGRSNEALAAANRSVELGPTIARTHCNQAHVLCSVGRYEDALEAADQALHWEENDPCAFMNLSWAYRGIGRLDDALEAAQRAIDLDVGREEGHRRLSEVLVELGQYEDALAAINRAFELEPDNVEVQGQRVAVLNLLEPE